MLKYNVGDSVRIIGETVFKTNLVGEIGTVCKIKEPLCTGGIGICVKVHNKNYAFDYDKVDHVNTSDNCA